MIKYHAEYNTETQEILQIHNAEKGTLPENTVPIKDNRLKDKIVQEPFNYRVIDKNIVYTAQPEPIQDAFLGIGDLEHNLIGGYLEETENETVCWQTDTKSILIYTVAALVNSEKLNVPCMVKGEYTTREVTRERMVKVLRGILDLYTKEYKTKINQD